MNIKVIDSSGAEKDSVDVSDSIFAIEPNEGVIHRAVENERANKRQGTACTKGRSEVSGTTSKPWRQKGTGRARAGSVKSPIWRGGGTVFGPKPRDYSYSIPKKMKQLSIRSIFSKREKEKRVQVVEDIPAGEGKTKDITSKILNMSLMKNDLKDLKNNKFRKKARNYTIAIITSEDNPLLRRACRNLPWVKCMSYRRLSAFDLFYSNEIMIEKGVLSGLEDLYARETGK
ncbi:MAG: 50S ribosomal protein L4 [Spirochaetota bacterium]|nr:50S ribosomal protein L4 [Spirochaetota bacterium]